MWIKKLGYISLLALIFASCKKADFYENDPEDALMLDTAVFIRSANYVSHTSTQLVVEVEMVKFNGITSESSYSEVMHDSIYDADPSIGNTVDFTLSSSGPTQITYGPSNYSNIFVFSRYNPWWYPYFAVTPFLQRYLEQIESSGSEKYAMCMSGINEDQISVFEEFEGQPFDNSTDYTIQNLMERTKSLGEYSDGDAYTTANYCNEITNLINTLGSSPEYNGSKSITFFLDQDLEYDVALTAVIAAANTASIQLNFVGPNLGYHVAALAHGTGGFVVDGLNHINFDNVATWDPDNPVKNIGVGLSNLNSLLAGNYTTERRTFTINATAGSPFTAGKLAGFTFRYNDELFETAVFIP